MYVPLSDIIPKIYVFKCIIIKVDGFSKKSSMARQTALNHVQFDKERGYVVFGRYSLVTRWVKMEQWLQMRDKINHPRTLPLITAASFLLELGGIWVKTVQCAQKVVTAAKLASRSWDDKE